MKKQAKYNLTDMTFLVPLRVDSMVRLENMLMSLRYLLRHFETNIVVLHADGYDNGIIPKLLDKSIKYRFVEDYDAVFYRTKYLNCMTAEVATPYLAIWDADVIVPKEQIADAVQKLREGYEIAYPYDGQFYDTTYIVREQFWKTGSIKTLVKNQAKMGLIYGTNMKGGAMFVNREAYMAAGMENEKFYGWGPEDWERSDRWKILDYKTHQSEGCLYHLTHNRGSNSTFRSMEQMKDSNKERQLTTISGRNEILNRNIDVNQ
jgi:hypothetical protein